MTLGIAMIKLPPNAPINLSIVKVENPAQHNLKQVKTGQIFTNTGLFHPEGLFSSEIFGNVGTDGRSRTFGYIDLGVTILHPLIYETIVGIKSFYRQIAEGTVTAIFNSKTGEFEKSTDEKASTGYAFFLSHVEQLKFQRNGADTREFQIRLFEESLKRDIHKLRYVLVMPAGIRDYMITPGGKPEEDEINSYYRKILAQSSIIDAHAAKKTPEAYDTIAVGLQNRVVELYDYVISLMDGKHKFILAKWASRKIFNSTRNVISSYVDRTQSMDDPRRMRYNEVMVGLHQYARSLAPKSLHEIKSRYIRDIFVENSTSCLLVNAKTLEKEEVLSTAIAKDYDLWTSSDGLEKVIASLGSPDIRDLPVLLNKGKHYLGLLYRDKKYFRFMQDIRELPKGLDPKYVHPITLSEFIYISLYRTDGKYPSVNTRYPITGYGSIYPAMIRLTTTSETDILEELNQDWLPSGEVAVNFPILGQPHHNTMTPSSSHLALLGADFDGDMMSLIATMSDESLSEITQLLNKKEYYVSDSGQFFFSVSTDTLQAVMRSIT